MVRPIRICILGGGFGGLYTALQLSGYRWPSRPKITLVDKKDNFLFAPLLYEPITGELAEWEIAPTYQKLLAGTSIEFERATVRGVDLDRRQVILSGEKVLEYDRLVIAVGGYTALPGALNSSRSDRRPMLFRSLADLEQLMVRVHELSHTPENRVIAIAGGGPNGVELACKLADKLYNRTRIVIIDRGGQILKDFPIGVQKAAIKALARRGVEVRSQTNILSVGADYIKLETAEKVETLSVDLMVWAIGTKIYDWVQALPCDHSSNGKLKTLPTLQLTDYPEVFALGDTAAVSDRNFFDRFLPPKAKSNKYRIPATAQVAFQQAPVAAKNIRASLLGKPLQKFRYLHLGDMMTLGKNDAIVSSFGINLTGAIAALIRKTVYLQRMPTNRHRFQVAKHRLFPYFRSGFLQLRRSIFHWKRRVFVLWKQLVSYGK